MRKISRKPNVIVRRHWRVTGVDMRATRVIEHRRETATALGRRIRTTIVKKVVPRPVRNALAGWYLFGRSTITQYRDADQRTPEQNAHMTKVAKRMRKKAWQWTKGNRKEPDPNGQWNAMHGPARRHRSDWNK